MSARSRYRRNAHTAARRAEARPLAEALRVDHAARTVAAADRALVDGGGRTAVGLLLDVA